MASLKFKYNAPYCSKLWHIKDALGVSRSLTDSSPSSSIDTNLIEVPRCRMGGEWNSAYYW